MQVVKFFDSVGKIGTGLTVIFVVLIVVFPQLTGITKALYSMRSGVVGVVKYELGTEKNGDFPERKPTIRGQLYLLKSTSDEKRDWVHLGFGDLLVVKSSKYLRSDNGCSAIKMQNCGSSPRVMLLKEGQCLVVLERLYAGEDKPVEGMKDIKGGWLKVATTKCRIFE